MNCKCGGSTSDHKVIRNKEPVGMYAQCTSCGRVSWLWKNKELVDELNNREVINGRNKAKVSTKRKYVFSLR